jgi:copper chaperone CopZ
MRKAVFPLGSLECTGCARKIEDQLIQHKGVRSAKVYVRLGKVRTEFDEKMVSVEELAKVLTKWTTKIPSN